MGQQGEADAPWTPPRYGGPPRPPGNAGSSHDPFVLQRYCAAIARRQRFVLDGFAASPAKTTAASAERVSKIAFHGNAAKRRRRRYVLVLAVYLMGFPRAQHGASRVLGWALDDRESRVRVPAQIA
ncbi:MAG TPA: hypothetical protein VMU33_20255 [Burkholderiaceae bacterium]|nr:hypothetical protein [Burkholderiaceae bacterium]